MSDLKQWHTAALACWQALVNLSGRCIQPDGDENAVLQDLRDALATAPPPDGPDPFCSGATVRAEGRVATSFHGLVFELARDWSGRTWEKCRQLGQAIIMPRLAELERVRPELVAEYFRTVKDSTGQGEGSPPPAGPYADLRQLASDQLKGQERAVVEALCDAGGKLLLTALAFKKGVGWEDPPCGFSNVQRRLKPKLKRAGWAVERCDNSAHLVKLKAHPKTV
jgi:hypothetical protein